ncbi:MAG: RdgB/HAM1 family non-canonical purine NTP pyrophosphatase [Alphaproteobacteria bacterium]|nr:RdgB/HAM1 family non-canonical purine NTP pyrophosphatase [Alphaproteobacteria bacterium]
MLRKFDASELVIATHNPGKAREIAELLKPYVPRFYNAAELGLAEPEETGSTFIENAVLKAKAAALASGKVALADDSGVAVTALGGEPGIYSARWAGPGKDFYAAMKQIHEKLGDAKDRSAAFICVLALAWPDGHTEVFEGRLEGEMIWPPRGDKGFGYDPMFVPGGHERTFGEMEAAEKHEISHRAKAFKLLKKIFHH